MNLQRAGTTALFIGFTALGLAMAVLGSGTYRAYGAAFVLLMGGGGFGWFFATASRQGTGLRIGATMTIGHRDAAFVADYSGPRQLASGFSLTSAVVGGMLIALIPGEDGSSRVPAWGVFALGLPLLAIGAFLVANAVRGARLVMTSIGLAAESATGRTFVRWDQLAAMEVDADEPTIKLHVADAARVQRHGLHGLTFALAKLMTGGDIVIPLRTLRTDPAQLLIALDRYAGNPGLRPLVGTAGELAQVRAAAAELRDTPADARDGRGIRRGPRLRRLFAAISLLLVGLVLGLVTLTAAVGDWLESGQLQVGTGVLSALAVAHFFAGVLTWKGRTLGRWLGLGLVIVAVVVVAAIVVGLAVAGSDAERPAGTLVVAGILAVHAALVIWDVVRWERPPRESQPESDTLGRP